MKWHLIVTTLTEFLLWFQICKHIFFWNHMQWSIQISINSLLIKHIIQGPNFALLKMYMIPLNHINHFCQQCNYQSMWETTSQQTRISSDHFKTKDCNGRLLCFMLHWVCNCQNISVVICRLSIKENTIEFNVGE